MITGSAKSSSARLGLVLSGGGARGPFQIGVYERLLREMDDARGWRSWATRAEERIFTALRFNRGERLVFRPAAELVSICEREGLETTVEPMWGSTPFANVLVEARRPASG